MTTTAASLRSAMIVLLYYIILYIQQYSLTTLLDDTHVLQTEDTSANHVSWYSTLCFNNTATSGGKCIHVHPPSYFHPTCHQRWQQQLLLSVVGLSKRLSDQRSSDDNDGSYVERSETVVIHNILNIIYNIITV